MTTGWELVVVTALLTGITVASRGVELEFNNVQVARPVLEPAAVQPAPPPASAAADTVLVVVPLPLVTAPLLVPLLLVV
uniref:Secreted protein n=1 Tax=Anopheles darlingi TaxID=43151 RepID=A0A2M4DRD0_ANODA